MARHDGYVSADCVTVAELREVLTAASDDDRVHVVLSLATGEDVPLKAAMFNGESDSPNVLLYIEHPGEE
jgi:hypothetical protein